MECLFGWETPCVCQLSSSVCCRAWGRGHHHSCQEETLGFILIQFAVNSVKEAEQLHEQNNVDIENGLTNYVHHICVSNVSALTKLFPTCLFAYSGTEVTSTVRHPWLNIGKIGRQVERLQTSFVFLLSDSLAKTRGNHDLIIGQAGKLNMSSLIWKAWLSLVTEPVYSDNSSWFPNNYLWAVWISQWLYLGICDKTL